MKLQVGTYCQRNVSLVGKTNITALNLGIVNCLPLDKFHPRGHILGRFCYLYALTKFAV